jgi:formylglycine-generating enzyme required for sulfatase activity
LAFDAPTNRCVTVWRFSKEPKWCSVAMGFRVVCEAEAKPAPMTPLAAVAPFNAEKAKELQDAWAAHLGVKSEITNSIDMKLRLIPPGEFMMGSGAEEIERLAPNKLGGYFPVGHARNEGPRHAVRITRPFAMSSRVVTIGQFRAFVQAMGYKTEAETKGGGTLLKGGRWVVDPDGRWSNPGWETKEDHPATCLSYNDALAFCAWLSKKEKKVYRLPTEAEWEYACRAGTTTAFHFGETLGPNRASQPYRDAVAPNAFGLFNMHGQVWNWCSDYFASDYYGKSPSEDPVGPDMGTGRVVRGGMWTSKDEICRSAFRTQFDPSSTVSDRSFRVVCDLTPPAATGAFVIVAKDQRAETRHPTLSDAVKAAKSGDTLEIRGDGPFEIPPLSFGKRTLTIRAGTAFRPVLKLNEADTRAGTPLIITNAALVLEGLEMQRVGDITPNNNRKILHSTAPLHVANCRFVNVSPDASGIRTARSIEMYGADLRVSNCEFLNNHTADRAIALQSQPDYRSEIRNCIFTSRGVELCFFKPGGSVLLEQCTFFNHAPLWLHVFQMPAEEVLNDRTRPASVSLRSSIFRRRIHFAYVKSALPPEAKELTADEIAALLPRLLGWTEANTLHHAPTDDRFLMLGSPANTPLIPTGSYRTLADWKRFWGLPDLDAREGEMRFQGEEIWARLQQDVRFVTPADFRLIKGSPGQGVLPGGKDIGANVDLVGPGDAYERWKKTPDHQEWRKKADELMTAPRP